MKSARAVLAIGRLTCMEKWNNKILVSCTAEVENKSYSPVDVFYAFGYYHKAFEEKDYSNYLLGGYELGTHITTRNFTHSTCIIYENSNISQLKPVDTYSLGKQSDQ